MHELSLAMSLVGQVQDLLQEHEGAKVLKVCVSMGKLSGVEREAFEFCYPMACEETPLQGSSLEVKEIPITIECGECGKRSEISEPILECAYCKSSAISIADGKDFIINSFEIE